jgi:hypothetical protein
MRSIKNTLQRMLKWIIKNNLQHLQMKYYKKDFMVHIKCIVMYIANYFLINFSVFSASRRKLRNTPKDRDKKILFSRGIQKSSI